jgi:conjugative transfer region protein TrbK
LAGGGSQAPQRATSPATPRDAELSRCQTLGEGAGDDVRCRSAWRVARSRFFGGAAS